MGISTATQVSAGEQHACALLAGGAIRCWGANTHGELGDGSTENRSLSVAVQGISGAIAVEALGQSTCAILADHSTSCWGANNLGQLADGTGRIVMRRSRPPPGSVATSPVARMARAPRSRLGAWCRGSNQYGELGDGVVNRFVPTATAAFPAVSSLATLWTATCALMADGTVQCWGSREGGPLGDGVGEPSSVPVVVPGVASAVQVAGTGSHACARLADGTLRCWGQGYVGQLGDGSRSSRARRRSP